MRMNVAAGIAAEREFGLEAKRARQMREISLWSVCARSLSVSTKLERVFTPGGVEAARPAAEMGAAAALLVEVKEDGDPDWDDGCGGGGGWNGCCEPAEAAEVFIVAARTFSTSGEAADAFRTAAIFSAYLSLSSSSELTPSLCEVLACRTVPDGECDSTS